MTKETCAGVLKLPLPSLSGLYKLSGAEPVANADEPAASVKPMAMPTGQIILRTRAPAYGTAPLLLLFHHLCGGQVQVVNIPNDIRRMCL